GQIVGATELCGRSRTIVATVAQRSGSGHGCDGSVRRHFDHDSTIHVPGIEIPPRINGQRSVSADAERRHRPQQRAVRGILLDRAGSIADDDINVAVSVHSEALESIRSESDQSVARVNESVDDRRLADRTPMAAISEGYNPTAEVVWR